MGSAQFEMRFWEKECEFDSVSSEVFWVFIGYFMKPFQVVEVFR